MCIFETEIRTVVRRRLKLKSAPVAEDVEKKKAKEEKATRRDLAIDQIKAAQGPMIDTPGAIIASDYVNATSSAVAPKGETSKGRPGIPASKEPRQSSESTHHLGNMMIAPAVAALRESGVQGDDSDSSDDDNEDHA